MGPLAVLTLEAAAGTMTGVGGGEAGGVGGDGEKEGTMEGVIGVATLSTFISSGGFSRISNSRVNGNTSCFTISTMLSVAGNFSLTPFISLIRLVLEISGISLGATLQDFLHISSSISSVGEGSDASVQDVGLGIGIVSSFEEESSHLSSVAVVNTGWLLRAAEVGEATVLRASGEIVVGDGGRVSSGMASTAVTSDVWPACSFFSPLRARIRTGEGVFNTGSGFGFSSGKEKNERHLGIIFGSEVVLYYFRVILSISYSKTWAAEDRSKYYFATPKTLSYFLLYFPLLLNLQYIYKVYFEVREGINSPNDYVKNTKGKSNQTCN